MSSSLRQSLDEDLGIPNLAGCIISGDLTWKADPEEYQPVAFRIVVLHHHLLPVTYREEPRSGQIYSVVLDAEALAQWVVKHRVRLVLHGHMHQPFCAKVARPIDLAAPSSEWHSFHVIGLGSTGVERGHLGTVGKNVFGLLRFGRDRLKVGVHTIDPGDRSQPLWELDIPYREEGN